MLTGDGQKFIGDDGIVKRATFGAEVKGDGITPLPVGSYLITSVGTPSGFPSALMGGIDPAGGDVIEVETSISIVPLTDDDVVTLVLEDQCDISSWRMDFTKEEVDVTTLCDFVKKYRAGKGDMAGTMTGIFTAGISDAIDGRLQEFLDIVRQDGAVSYSRYSQQDTIMLGFWYINDSRDIGADIMKVVAPFQFYGDGLGGELGSAQTFESPFRFANLSYTDSNDNKVDIQPTYYRLGDGST